MFVHALLARLETRVINNWADRPLVRNGTGWALHLLPYLLSYLPLSHIPSSSSPTWFHGLCDNHGTIARLFDCDNAGIDFDVGWWQLIIFIIITIIVVVVSVINSTGREVVVGTQPRGIWGGQLPPILFFTLSKSLTNTILTLLSFYDLHSNVSSCCSLFVFSSQTIPCRPPHQKCGWLRAW